MWKLHKGVGAVEEELRAGELTKQSNKTRKWSHNGDGEKEDDSGDGEKEDDNTLGG